MRCCRAAIIATPSCADVRRPANLLGTWLLVVYGLTQHAGLAEMCSIIGSIADRLHESSQPIPLLEHNYHIEHHMFPGSFHALPNCMGSKGGLSIAYPSCCCLAQSFRVLHQVRDPAWHVSAAFRSRASELLKMSSITDSPDSEGWIAVCNAAKLAPAVSFALIAGGKPTQSAAATTGALRRRWHLHPRECSSREGLVKDDIIECQT